MRHWTLYRIDLNAMTAMPQKGVSAHDDGPIKAEHRKYRKFANRFFPNVAFIYQEDPVGEKPTELVIPVLGEYPDNNAYGG